MTFGSKTARKRDHPSLIFGAFPRDFFQSCSKRPEFGSPIEVASPAVAAFSPLDFRSAEIRQPREPTEFLSQEPETAEIKSE